MHKTSPALLLVALLAAGSVLAAQADLDALTTAGVRLSNDQSNAIRNAREAEDITATMEKLVASVAAITPADEAAVTIKAAVNTMVTVRPHLATAIVSATSRALADSPNLVATVVEAAVAAAPNQSKNIAKAAKSSVPGATRAIDNAVSNGLSSVIYKQHKSPQNAPQPESNRSSRHDPASPS
ncbi:hypothetical protein [Zobellella maritima]|uniref:hypothetical protein n=1 Tax=Zobellella maritima TaxID=2059725 RepID=UPI000E306884|nr:hypothetical protein [Zobellella maritima]